ncbi:hypothetical protein CM19_01065 [Candidatus Acidianus copahuensis]|uniref:Uncharacterized protein n=1 Tax=Candidatus Acidianus copahuensis TaxID=1160895 RepID=A0A031LV08_9CREN|nr:hypothetical protein [Candidatus Acidianus copahuensis]EZQ11339.1 hypothetical protein CM19_01065 [Candidatus Acidianus copahuensis]
MEMKLKRSEVFLPLTQALLKILKVIKINPNFHTVEEIAEALAAYYLQLSFHKLKLPPSTAYYYFQKLQNYLEELPKPRRVAIDETKILHVNGKYLWVIVDIDTRKVVKIYMTTGRSGADVYKITTRKGRALHTR